jgi:hypothetical protein
MRWLLNMLVPVISTQNCCSQGIPLKAMFLLLLVPSHLVGVSGLLRLLCPVTGGLMWRTAKAEVSGEMGIPPQHHHTTVLRLSAIERHWYNRYSSSTQYGMVVQDMCMCHTSCMCDISLHNCALGCLICAVLLVCIPTSPAHVHYTAVEVLCMLACTPFRVWSS